MLTSKGLVEVVLDSSEAISSFEMFLREIQYEFNRLYSRKKTLG